MIEISSNLFVGSAHDYEHRVRLQAGWHIVHACKDPYHRQAVGYTGRGAPQNHPEYLVARRANRLMMNLVDVDDPSFVRKELIDDGLAFVDEALRNQSKVLIHCNKGESRAPAIGLLYLVSRTNALPLHDLGAAEVAFRRIYPAYHPAAGIRGFVRAHFSIYAGRTAGGLPPDTQASENWYPD